MSHVCQEKKEKKKKVHYLGENDGGHREEWRVCWNSKGGSPSHHTVHTWEVSAPKNRNSRMLCSFVAWQQKGIL